jgi:tRNA threonylcarbamoyladenosine biosynthesis protein TsaB
MCSAALAVDGEVVAIEELNDGYSHAEKLAPFVDELLHEQGWKVQDLDAIAVSKGPGSYTGLRIGVSLAKGLAYAAEKPLIAVDTLQQMCLHPAVQKELEYLKDPMLCPMLDARRMEVYAAIYDIGLVASSAPQPVILDKTSFRIELEKDAVLFFGNGSDKFRDVVTAQSAYFVADVWPSAGQMAPLAQMAFEAERFEDLAYFEPNYVKPFQGTTPKPKV